MKDRRKRSFVRLGPDPWISPPLKKSVSPGSIGTSTAFIPFGMRVWNEPLNEAFERLQRARELLAGSHQTITEIADETGFDNPFYFSLRFKKETGVNPRTYRQRLSRK